MDFSCAAARGADAQYCALVARRGASASASEVAGCVRGADSRAGLAFDRSRRLTRREDFERLFREGERRSAGGYLFYLARRESGPARLGIVISRRHARLAATRNAIKRYIREAFRLEQSKLGAMDLLVRPPLGLKPSGEMLQRLRSLLGRLNP